MFEENSSTTGVRLTSTTIIIISMIFGNHGLLRSSSLINLELVALDFQQTQFLLMNMS